MKTFIVSNYRLVRDFYKRYERVLMSGSLVGGFLFDFVLFVNIDLVFKFTVLAIYWVCAGAAIAFMQVHDAKYGNPKSEARNPKQIQNPNDFSDKNAPSKIKYLRLFMPLVVQWTFGGLLNISLIFYWFSGAFSVSWPLLAITVLLLLFNDSFRQHFSKPLVAISIYFFVTFALFSLVLPFWFVSLSPWLFVAAGGASLVIIGAYIYGISVFTGYSLAQRYQFFISIICIAAVMNVLYFTNIIPPIPLAMREAGLYHSLVTSRGKYIMQGEPENFWQNIQDAVFGQTVRVYMGPASAQGSGEAKEKIYLYTAIFAPDNLHTTIVDRWQYYDSGQKIWVDKGKLSFAINGGRQEGYKGYSWQSNLAVGKWRVYVENQRGQVLGRVRFTVEKVDAPVKLQEVTR